MKVGDFLTKDYSNRIKILEIKEDTNELVVNITRKTNSDKFKQHNKILNIDETKKNLEDGILKNRESEMFDAYGFPPIDNTTTNTTTLDFDFDGHDDDTEWYHIWKKDWWNIAFKL